MKMNEDFINNLKSEVNFLSQIINEIKKYEYKPFFNIFFIEKTFENKGGIDFIVEELNRIINELNINDKDFKNNIFNIKNMIEAYKINLDQFLFVLVNNNIEFLKQIQEDILIPIEGGAYNFNVFGFILKLNSNISNNLYNIFSQFELFLKKVIVSLMTTKEKRIGDVSECKFVNFQDWKKIEMLRPQEDYKKNWKIFNIMTFGEIIDFLKKIKSEEKDFLKEILISILGFYKFENDYSKKDLLLNKKNVLDNLIKIKKLRNKVMHFEYLLPKKDENILMEGIKSLISISKSNRGESDEYLKLHATILNLTTNFLSQINDKQILIFFQEKILSFKVY